MNLIITNRIEKRIAGIEDMSRYFLNRQSFDSRLYQYFQYVSVVVFHLLTRILIKRELYPFK